MPESDRCRGWRTGKCLGLPSHVGETCKDCGMTMTASNHDDMEDIIASHVQKIGGVSQCDKKKQGLL